MRKKIIIDLGCGGNKLENKEPETAVVFGLDIHPFDGVDIVCDLEGTIPLESDYADTVLASHILEHISNPIHIMNEIYRILRMGGDLHFVVPSTDGMGAFQDPTHKSFWNENSFLYYTKDGYRGLYPDLIKCKFQLRQLQVTKAVSEDDFRGVVVVSGILRKESLPEDAPKEGEKNDRISENVSG
jgi:SAM-dependent methyltransferase